jgi:hypothetical protein
MVLLDYHDDVVNGRRRRRDREPYQDEQDYQGGYERIDELDLFLMFSLSYPTEITASRCPFPDGLLALRLYAQVTRAERTPSRR